MLGVAAAGQQVQVLPRGTRATAVAGQALLPLLLLVLEGSAGECSVLPHGWRLSRCQRLMQR